MRGTPGTRRRRCERQGEPDPERHACDDEGERHSAPPCAAQRDAPTPYFRANPAISSSFSARDVFVAFSPAVHGGLR